MADIVSLIETLPDAERAGALKVLDLMSRPLRPKEIEALLRVNRVTKARATTLAGVLKGFHIIALLGPEGGHE